MGYDIKERWIELCEKAAVEQDLGKLLAFMTEINSLLEAKESRQALTDQGTPDRRAYRAETAITRKIYRR